MQHYLRKYRDALRAVCCQHGATEQRLDELLQAMGAQPMEARCGRVLPPGAADAHAARSDVAELASRAARTRPDWLLGLLSRLRAPAVGAAEQRASRAQDESV
jgi:hypothetical protein